MWAHRLFLKAVEREEFGTADGGWDCFATTRRQAGSLSEYLAFEGPIGSPETGMLMTRLGQPASNYGGAGRQARGDLSSKQFVAKAAIYSANFGPPWTVLQLRLKESPWWSPPPQSCSGIPKF